MSKYFPADADKPFYLNNLIQNNLNQSVCAMFLFYENVGTGTTDFVTTICIRFYF